MSKSIPQIKTVNAETGEEIVRDANAEELAQIEIDIADRAAQESAEQAKATAKNALLEKLGITAEEAALLLS